MDVIVFFMVLDIAQQREHDRRVAEEAVAKARIEWERQMQQNSPLKQQPAAAPVPPAPVTTIIHSGKFSTLRRIVCSEANSNGIWTMVFHLSIEFN